MAALAALPRALRQLRERRDLVLAQAQAATGVDASNLSRYETGKQTPDLATLERMLDGYGATFTELALLLEEPSDEETEQRRRAAAVQRFRERLGDEVEKDLRLLVADMLDERLGVPGKPPKRKGKRT